MFHYSHLSRRTFGELISKAREDKSAELGQTLQAYAVAKQLDISQEMYFAIERGQVPDGMQASTLLKLVQFYKLDMNHVADVLGIPLKE